MKINWFKVNNSFFVTHFFTMFNTALSSLTYNDINYVVKYLKMGYLCEDCREDIYKCDCENYKNETLLLSYDTNLYILANHIFSKRILNKIKIS